MSYSKETCACCGHTGTVDKVSFKTAKTIKDYPTKSFGYSFTVPTGSRVANHTACGNDDGYRFWQDFHKIAEKLTGYKNSILHHDLEHYGLTIPAEFCEPYTE